jgi:hypothetical protein
MAGFVKLQTLDLREKQVTAEQTLVLKWTLPNFNIWTDFDRRQKFAPSRRNPFTP